MIRFILNEKTIATELPAGTVLLDLIRYHEHLTGTKIGCREGDCGACTVLVGELVQGKLRYQSMTSCLLPLGNINGKHVVTVEGTNLQGLNPVQQAMADEGATQCGFCTPGFVVSLSGYCLTDREPSQENAIAAIDGNICRCTGYKSIERAASRITAILQERKNEDPIRFATGKKLLPAYFNSIQERLAELEAPPPETHSSKLVTVGGGTDLYVQKHDEMTHAKIDFAFDKKELNEIRQDGNKIIIGAAVSVSDLRNSGIVNEYFPDFLQYSKLVSSTPIRNMATIAGNFVNASPIGDLTIFFLALDAELALSSGRKLALRNFYKGYKQLDKNPEEAIVNITIDIPAKNSFFHFEKVSKRTHLDIASVNTSIALDLNGDTIIKAGLSAGGVGPIPMFLQKASALLKGKKITDTLINEAIASMKTEISPISDARGTKEYKTLLLEQLIRVHFMNYREKVTLRKDQSDTDTQQ